MTGPRLLQLATILLALIAVTQPARAQRVDVLREVALCYTAPAIWIEAASNNERTLHTLDWEPFGREIGWETYVPLTQQELGTHCDAGTPEFARRLAEFQARYGLLSDGRFGPATFEVLKGLWQERRPFVMARVRGECPRAPERHELAEFDYTEESVRRPGRMAHAVVIAAFRRMVSDARREDPEIAADPDLLTVYSTYRHPDIDGVRCEDQQNCDGLRRASCSAHRTGWALDINVGHAPDHGIDSTNAYNRLWQTRGPAYRWLVRNARRYGFVNYVYEPWHWEYVGPEADYAP